MGVAEPTPNGYEGWLGHSHGAKGVAKKNPNHPQGAKGGGHNFFKKIKNLIRWPRHH
jgi:hypothetical protein